MDVSLESKSLSSVGYSRKSYLQVTSRGSQGKLVHLHERRSLALPSVGLAAKLAFILRLSASNLSHISGNFRRKSTTLYKKAAKSLRNKRVISQHFCKMLPSAWSDRLAMAVTPSFQLRIANRLKHWIVDFLSFETTYSMHQLDFRNPNFIYFINFCFHSSFALSLLQFLLRLLNYSIILRYVFNKKTCLKDVFFSFPINKIFSSSNFIL
ncbi:hypothetical protein AAG906_039359 [Vitis piasezkii]